MSVTPNYQVRGDTTPLTFLRNTSAIQILRLKYRLNKFAMVLTSVVCSNIFQKGVAAIHAHVGVIVQIYSTCGKVPLAAVMGFSTLDGTRKRRHAFESAIWATVSTSSYKLMNIECANVQTEVWHTIGMACMFQVCMLRVGLCTGKFEFSYVFMCVVHIV